MEKDFVRYYFKYKELVEVHRELKFGNAPRTSEGFSEGLCAELYNMKKATGVSRAYDLIDQNGRRIEVKATVDSGGATTMNPNSVFDYLYWLNFQLNMNCVWVRKYSYDIVLKYIRDNDLKGKRVNVSLSKFEKIENEMEMFEFVEESGVVRKLSLEDQVEVIKRGGARG